MAGIVKGHNRIHERGVKMGPGTLDLEGLPEPVARGLEAVAEMARKILRPSNEADPAAPELPRWRLGVIGTLSRDEMTFGGG